MVIPTSVTDIEDYAFYVCYLRSITIPSSIVSIGSYAFYNCTLLSSVTIPSSVTKIGYQTFAICKNLTSLNFEDSTNWYKVDNATDWANAQNGTAITLGTDSENATNFNNVADYRDYYWYKK